jgi:hypothetical protein
VGDARVKLSLWDTAGQERFRAITRQYYRAMHAVVFGEHSLGSCSLPWCMCRLAACDLFEATCRSAPAPPTSGRVAHMDQPHV